LSFYKNFDYIALQTDLFYWANGYAFSNVIRVWDDVVQTYECLPDLLKWLGVYLFMDCSWTHKFSFQLIYAKTKTEPVDLNQSMKQLQILWEKLIIIINFDNNEVFEETKVIHF